MVLLMNAHTITNVCSVVVAAMHTSHTHTHTSHMCPHSVHTHMHTGDRSLGWQCDPRDVQAESHRRQLLKGCSGGAPLVSEPVRLPNNSRADVTSTRSLYVGRLPKPLWTLLVPGISTRWVMAIYTHYYHGNHIVRNEIPVLNGNHGNGLIIYHTQARDVLPSSLGIMT